jgi:DNA-binding NtrC family response regulator
MTTANQAKRILVVASDEPIGEIVAAMLRTAGYECDEVCEHKAILRVLKRIAKYNLLFCQVSALEEEEKLLTWTLGTGRDTPLVACAARRPEGVPKAIYERCNFLQAPFDREQLLNVVRDSLNTHD